MPFDMGAYYGVVATVCAIIIGILLNRVKDTVYKEAIDVHFCRLLYFFIAFCCVDAIWGFLSSQVVFDDYVLMVIFSYSFHSFAALSAFMWSNYMLYYLNIHDRTKTVLTVIRIVVLFVQFSILLSNIKTHALFDVEYGTTIYHAYVLRNVMFYVQFSYYIVLLAYVTWCLFKETDSKQKRTYISAFVFSFVILVFGLGQMYLPDVSMYSLGFMLSAVMIYAFNTTDQREAYMREVYEKENTRLSSLISGLSKDILYVYLVDVNTDEYEIYSNGQRMNDFTDFATFSDLTRFIIDNVVYKKDREMFAEAIKKENVQAKLARSDSFNFIYRGVIGDKLYRYYRMKAVRSSIEESKIIVGIYDEDERIRNQLKQENKLRQATSIAEKASKAKTEFLFNMSHDIRTPMNAILGFTDMAKRHINEKDTVIDCLDKVSSSGDHLLNLINDVLDMSRIESGKVEISLDVNNFKTRNNAMVTMLRELAAKKNIDFSCEYRGLTNENLIYDSLHLNQIMVNIISNAIKYTPENGRVEYIVEQVPGHDADHVLMKMVVKDNGIGMTRDFVDHIFEEFAREKSATISGVEGTGLGMSIVKNLADMMNGDLRIESEKNVGTTVYFEIPLLISKEVINEDENNLSLNGDLLKNKHILLVEDNELNREIAKDILEEAGMVVDEADDGSVALDIIENKGSRAYDAILMDIQMPIMDGYTATRAIRALPSEHDYHVPIIAMTANAFSEDKNNALEAGMDAHLAKPINIDDLLRTLSSLM